MTEGPSPPAGGGRDQAPTGPEARPRAHRGLDRAIGIILGLLLGVGIVTAFVFLGSEEVLDAPRISGEEGGGGRQSPSTPQPPSANGEGRSGNDQPRPDGKPRPQPGPIPLVRVVGGAPPPSGPVRLRFSKGSRVRFRVLTDAPVEIEVVGYGIRRIVESAEVIAFPASRSGQFPVVVTASEIGIASLKIGR